MLDTAAPTYDLAAPGSETIGLDEFNALVLDVLARDTPARDTPARDTPARDTPARDTRLEAHR